MSDEKAHHKKEADKAKMETRNQTQKGGMSDDKAHHKKEAEKVKLEAWSQTQKVEMSDEKAHHKKETEKAKLETWSQTQKGGMFDEETRRREEAEKTQEVMEKERFDEEARHDRGNYYPKPMNCGDCYFETHYENELFEHVKMHIDQLEKHTTNAQKGH